MEVVIDLYSDVARIGYTLGSPGNKNEIGAPGRQLKTLICPQ